MSLPIIPPNVGEVNVRAMFIWADTSIIIVWANDGEVIVVRDDEIVRFRPTDTRAVFRALVAHVVAHGRLSGYGEHLMNHQPGGSRAPAGGF